MPKRELPQAPIITSIYLHAPVTYILPSLLSSLGELESHLKLILVLKFLDSFLSPIQGYWYSFCGCPPSFT